MIRRQGRNKWSIRVGKLLSLLSASITSAARCFEMPRNSDFSYQDVHVSGHVRLALAWPQKSKFDMLQSGTARQYWPYDLSVGIQR